MRLRLSIPRPGWAAASGAVLLALAVGPAEAQVQQVGWPRPTYCPPAPCPTVIPCPQPDLIIPAPPAPPGPKEAPVPIPAPAAPTAPARPPESAATPPAPTPSPAPSPAAEAATSAAQQAFSAPEQGAALGGEGFALASSGVGYIDRAIPVSTVRLRYDTAYNNNRPDRAEFFYAKCGCFKVNGLDPNAPGPPLPERSVDYQDIDLYLEGAMSDRFSVFAEAPYRMLNPDINNNADNIGDMKVGAKYAFVACPDQYLTFQLRTYIPTGNAFLGLGTNHVSIEPALLWFQQLSEALTLEGEFRAWVPVGGTDFQGNVLRYGLGASYWTCLGDNARIAPVAEVVGWTVLDGKVSSLEVPIQDASGDTIVNGKLGVRLNVGDNHSFYAGYGRALTGEVWYKDLYRVEYRLTF